MRTQVSSILLEKAAEARARGHSWESIGKEISRAARTCRSWPIAYPAEWSRLFREAAFRYLNDAGGQAILVIHKLMGNENPWVALAAARTLLTNAVTEWVRDKLASQNPKDIDPELLKAMEHVKGLTNAQLNDLVAQLAAQPPLPVQAERDVGDGAALCPANGA